MNIEPTPADWLPVVMEDFHSFLQDHASCEKKASGMALNIASHYPDRPKLVNAMAELAVEELSHYRQVVRLLTDKGLQPGADIKDAYVNQLNGLIRRGTEHYLLDRLLLGAVIERRGSERFGLIAQALPEGPDRRFYEAIAASEARHWRLFVDLATLECGHLDHQQRLTQLTEAEAQIMRNQPRRPALH
ncbi:MAG: tRNA-(ms[2]io[6]A)-hydroxylase [Gammaproteobacteria bacterium]|nr:tRNA-(ms[2]io[6]A)-hydroxylase [Gammaproteobacteria bacterium]|tara:strand:+ start:534 stop:1100 length:567 start_codon:yes stop_codon:yes gene_type:complete